MAITLLFLVFFFFFSIIQAQNNNASLRVELIHLNSPKSPLYETLVTHSNRITNATDYSMNILTTHRKKLPKTKLMANEGDYLMSISIGTPKVSVMAIVDTGSSFTWTQCDPCKKCYKQNYPRFDSTKSSTFKAEPSSQYKLTYADYSYTRGDMGFDTFTIASSSGKSITFPNILFGCGRDNGGLFSPTTSGVIGLGPKQQSLVSQMGPTINGKFSYCLVPFTKFGHPSSINFGANPALSGANMVSTPLTITHVYELTLEAMSVDNKRIPYFSTSKENHASKKNIVIDSGSTFTYLPDEFYSKLEAEVVKKIKLTPMKDTGDESLKLCYKTQGDIKAPIITAHFTRADVKLNPINTFVTPETGNMKCFAFIGFKPDPSEFAVFGSIAQGNFLVGYDTKRKIVSFKPMDCTKYK